RKAAHGRHGCARISTDTRGIVELRGAASMVLMCFKSGNLFRSVLSVLDNPLETAPPATAGGSVEWSRNHKITKSQNHEIVLPWSVGVKHVFFNASDCDLLRASPLV